MRLDNGVAVNAAILLGVHGIINDFATSSEMGLKVRENDSALWWTLSRGKQGLLEIRVPPRPKSGVLRLGPLFGQRRRATYALPKTRLTPAWRRAFLVKLARTINP